MQRKAAIYFHAFATTGGFIEAQNTCAHQWERKQYFSPAVSSACAATERQAYCLKKHHDILYEADGIWSHESELQRVRKCRDFPERIRGT